MGGTRRGARGRRLRGRRQGVAGAVGRYVVVRLYSMAITLMGLSVLVFLIVFELLLQYPVSNLDSSTSD
jgi:hypothetical protein